MCLLCFIFLEWVTEDIKLNFNRCLLISFLQAVKEGTFGLTIQDEKSTRQSTFCLFTRLEFSLLGFMSLSHFETRNSWSLTFITLFNKNDCMPICFNSSCTRSCVHLGEESTQGPRGSSQSKSHSACSPPSTK